MTPQYLRLIIKIKNIILYWLKNNIYGLLKSLYYPKWKRKEKDNSDTNYKDLARVSADPKSNQSTATMATATATELCFLPNYHRRIMSPPSSSPKAWRSSPVKLAIKSQIQTQSLQKKKRRPENVDGEFFVGLWFPSFLNTKNLQLIWLFWTKNNIFVCNFINTKH